MSLFNKINELTINGDNGEGHKAVSGKYLSFVIAALFFIKIKLIGELYFIEIVFTVYVLYVFFLRNFIVNRLTLVILILGLLWLSNQVITDIVRESAFLDYARGWANISVFLMAFYAILRLIDFREDRAIWFFAGLTCSGLIKYIYFPHPNVQFDPWKWGLAGPVAGIFILVSYGLWKIKRCYLAAVMPLLFGLLSIYLGARSAGLVAILAGLIIAISTYQTKTKTTQGKYGRHLNIWKFIILTCLILAVIYKGYGFLAHNGYLGWNAQYIYDIQSSGKYGLLLGGRVEILASIEAIKDSPFIGHGSWAKNPKYKAYLQQLNNLGYNTVKMPWLDDSDLIPTHSYLFGAWVNAGIAGAIFWCFILWLVIRSILLIINRYHPLTPLIAFMATTSLWAIIFSPFGSDERVKFAFALVLLLQPFAITVNKQVAVKS